MSQDQLLNPAAAALIAGVHPKTLNQWADEGRIAVRRTPGGHRRYRRSDVEALLDASAAANDKADA